MLVLRFEAPALWTVRAGKGLPRNDRVLPIPFAAVDGGGVVRAPPTVSPGAFLPEVAPAGGFFDTVDIAWGVGRQRRELVRRRGSGNECCCAVDVCFVVCQLGSLTAAGMFFDDKMGSEPQRDDDASRQCIRSAGGRRVHINKDECLYGALLWVQFYRVWQWA